MLAHCMSICTLFKTGENLELKFINFLKSGVTPGARVKILEQGKEQDLKNLDSEHLWWTTQERSNRTST